jgi:hypothetical protein
MATLAFAEDFTSDVLLDSDLLGTPDSGLFWNRGVHPIVTLDNLLSMLPSLTATFTAYSASVTYSKFETSRKRLDVVTYSNKIYRSLLDSNINHTPGAVGSETYWLETTLASLKVKSFIWSVEDNVTSALALNRRLVENQYIYNLGSKVTTLSNDWSGWAFEPKGSDYIKIRINQMSLQANTTSPVNVFVINQGVLKATIILNPSSGLLAFEAAPYIISGKGVFYFVFASQSVLCDGAYNDPLKYEGFVCYPVNGIGAVAKDAVYSAGSNANGLNFNVSAYLDSTVYLENNKVDFAKFYQAQFELDFLKLATTNANTESNREQRNLNNDRTLALLATEALNNELNTVARNYLHQKKVAVDAINKTFDKYLHAPVGWDVEQTVI